MKSEERMISRKDACAMLNYSAATMRRRELAGRLTPYRDGHQLVRYRFDEVAALMKAENRKPANDDDDKDPSDA